MSSSETLFSILKKIYSNIQITAYFKQRQHLLFECCTPGTGEDVTYIVLFNPSSDPTR